MALSIKHFREVGSNANFIGGGQVYSLHSAGDTLATMLEDNYLDDVGMSLNVGDSIFLCGNDFNEVVRIESNNDSGVTVATMQRFQHNSIAKQVYEPTELLTITDGTVGLTTVVTDIDTTGAAGQTDYTLPDGDIGQVKIITLIIDGGNAKVTPDNPGIGFLNFTLFSAGNSITLLYKAGGWSITSIYDDA